MVSHAQSAVYTTKEAQEILKIDGRFFGWLVLNGYLHTLGKTDGRKRISKTAVHTFKEFWRSDWPEGVDPEGYIYLMRYMNLCKIGLSKDAQKRFKGMIRSLPEPRIKLIHTIPTNDMATAEARVHQFFATRRFNGEWFRLRPTEIRLITECKALIMG